MAKKTTELTYLDIVLNADAATIQQALEARKKIDTLLQEREEAYQRIAQLEEEIETIVGEEGVFSFPEPLLPVAGYTVSGPANRKKKPAAKSTPKPAKKESVEPVIESESETAEETESEPDSAN
jgi:hypothetical protein